MSGAFCPLKSSITAMRGGWQEPEGRQELGTWLLPWPCPALAEQCPQGSPSSRAGRGSAGPFAPGSSREGQCLHTATLRAWAGGWGGLKIPNHDPSSATNTTKNSQSHDTPTPRGLKGTAEC